MVEAQFGDFQEVDGQHGRTRRQVGSGRFEGAVAAIQNAIAAANSAFGNMNAMAKKFADAAQANIAAVTKKQSLPAEQAPAWRAFSWCKAEKGGILASSPKPHGEPDVRKRIPTFRTLTPRPSVCSTLPWAA